MIEFGVGRQKAVCIPLQLNEFFGCGSGEQMSMNSSAYQWISSNLSITGFTERNGAFMSCKELIENSVDATAGVADPAVSVRIYEEDGLLQIRCTDNGSGFRVDSVEALINVFHSTRSTEETATSCGKFGIGLKAMAYMSHSLCGGRQVSVSSPVHGTDTSVNFELSVGGSGEIEISDAHLGGQIETTSITVWSPRPESFVDFTDNLREYMNELVVFKSSLKLSLSVGDEEDEEYTHISCSRSVGHKDPSGLFECLVSIQTDNQQAQQTTQARIVRFVNGVPLLSQNTTSCILLQSIVLSLSKSSASMGIDLGATEVTAASSMVSVLRPIRTASPSSTWHQLTLRVNLTCPSCRVEYGSLLKESVVGGEASMSVAFGRGVKTALRKIQSRFKTQFQSNEDYERSRALQFYIPGIAKHLAEACMRIADESHRIRLGDLLANHDLLESKLKTALVESLGSTSTE